MKLIRKHPALFTYFLGVFALALGAGSLAIAVRIIGIGLVVGAVFIYASSDEGRKVFAADNVDYPGPM